MRRIAFSLGMVCGLALWCCESMGVTTIGSTALAGQARSQQYIGETFVVPAVDHFLTRFTLNGVASGGGVFHIAPWADAGPGADLFASPFGATVTYTQLVELPWYVDLTPGGTYVAYLTPTGGMPLNALRGTGYAEGGLAWFQTGFPWHLDTTDDLGFSAQFVLPEPGIVGMGVVVAGGAIGRRGRRR